MSASDVGTLEAALRVMAVTDEDNSDHFPSVAVEPSSREERLQMYMDCFTEEQRAVLSVPDEVPDHRGLRGMTFKEFCSHELDMMESEGFDIEDYSHVNDPGVMVRYHYPPHDPAPPQGLAEIKHCSRLAIRHFNTTQNTRFGNVELVKANVEPLCPYRYYITFQATDENNNTQTFQARVNVDFPPMKKEVELVRIKTAPKLFSIDSMHNPSHREC